MFGAEFMQAKREEAQRVAREQQAAKAAAEQIAAESQVATEATAPESSVTAAQVEAEVDALIAATERAAETEQATAAATHAKELDVIPWLRALGFRLDDARRAAAHCVTIPDSSLEERVRRALAFLAPRAKRQDFRRAEHREGASV